MRYFDFVPESFREKIDNAVNAKHFFSKLIFYDCFICLIVFSGGLFNGRFHRISIAALFNFLVV